MDGFSQEHLRKTMEFECKELMLRFWYFVFIVSWVLGIFAVVQSFLSQFFRPFHKLFSLAFTNFSGLSHKFFSGLFQCANGVLFIGKVFQLGRSSGANNMC